MFTMDPVVHDPLVQLHMFQQSVPNQREPLSPDNYREGNCTRRFSSPASCRANEISEIVSVATVRRDTNDIPA